MPTAMSRSTFPIPEASRCWLLVVAETSVWMWNKFAAISTWKPLPGDFFPQSNRSNLPPCPRKKSPRPSSAAGRAKRRISKPPATACRFPSANSMCPWRPEEQNALLATRPDGFRGRTLAPAGSAGRLRLCRCSLRSRSRLETDRLVGRPAHAEPITWTCRRRRANSSCSLGVLNWVESALPIVAIVFTSRRPVQDRRRNSPHKALCFRCLRG